MGNAFLWRMVSEVKQEGSLLLIVKEKIVLEERK
jgi:hypothetical protein